MHNLYNLFEQVYHKMNLYIDQLLDPLPMLSKLF
jgi:hypothetical protein